MSVSFGNFLKNRPTAYLCWTYELSTDLWVTEAVLKLKVAPRLEDIQQNISTFTTLICMRYTLKTN